MIRALALLLLASCTVPNDQRARAELDIGHASFDGLSVEVADGLAAIRRLDDHALELWSGAPVLDITLVVDDSRAGDWTIIARNSLVDSTLVVDGVIHTREPGDSSTVATFHVLLTAGSHALRVAPPDADRAEPFHFAAMADIQTALPVVDDIFTLISADSDVRFVLAMGDLTQRGQIDEYELLDRQLTTLAVPFYTTRGNHELWGDDSRFTDRFGRANFHFDFKGAAFTFVDSGDAGLDPLVEEWLDGWLAKAKDQPHVFLTHIPPIDPTGVRYGGFRSMRDAHRLLERLAEGNVDLTLYGHIHTFIQFDNAGIPAYISGGGGAQPMQGDGIDRHFLVVEIDASTPAALVPISGPIRAVDVHRVD